MRFVKQNTRSSQLNKQQMQYLDGIINEFCENLNTQASEKTLDPVIGRDDY